jgi:segregation and condensation protein A
MTAADRSVPATEPDLAGAGEGDSPQLDLAGFAGPLAQLLALARAQEIDLPKISLAALADQLTTALAASGHTTPLAQQGEWLVMAAWLVWLRSRLLLPPDAPAQVAAAVEAARLRDRLLALRAAQGLAAWLAARPQLGHDVFARGAPEWVGTGLATAHQVDVVGFLWAAMALFDDAARDGDTGAVYRPPWHDLHSPLDARQRILALLASLPDGAVFERFLPAAEAERHIPAREPLRRRSAWASTLLAGLELAREGTVALMQEATFMPIHLRQADAEATATPDPIDADAPVTG